MPDPKSRYKDAKTYTIVDRGRTRVVLAVPPAPRQPIRGEHLRIQGQRLDHLASFYLGDPNAFWRIAEANDVMLPEALTEAEVIKIPAKS